MNGIKRLLVRHVENNLVKYIIATIVFCVGVVLGVLAAMGGEHTQTLTEEVKKLCATMPDAEVNSAEILKTSFLKNGRIKKKTDGFTDFLSDPVRFAG